MSRNLENQFIIIFLSEYQNILLLIDLFLSTFFRFATDSFSERNQGAKTHTEFIFIFQE